jgi:putative phage-type endonuclease
MNAPTVTVDRAKFIGGSDIAAVLGISPWKTAVDLWLDKTAPRTEGETPRVLRRGSRLEPYIRDMITSEHGLKIVASNQRYIDKQVPYFAAEIDAETATDNVEIKTVHPFKARDWGDLDTDQLPIYYVAQAQWGLGITGRKTCRVFALIGDDLRPYVVERDDETIEALRDKAAEFWTRYVVPKLRPPLDFAHSLVQDTLRRLYPGTDGSAVEATAMHEHWRAVLKTATEAQERYEGVVNGARAHLMAEMGNAALLKFSDGKAFRRRQMTRKGYTVEPTTFMELRLINLKGDE